MSLAFIGETKLVAGGGHEQPDHGDGCPAESGGEHINCVWACSCSGRNGSESNSGCASDSRSPS